jgi:hypothetical protein
LRGEAPHARSTGARLGHAACSSRWLAERQSGDPYGGDGHESMRHSGRGSSPGPATKKRATTPEFEENPSLDTPDGGQQHRPDAPGLGNSKDEALPAVAVLTTVDQSVQHSQRRERS